MTEPNLNKTICLIESVAQFEFTDIRRDDRSAIRHKMCNICTVYVILRLHRKFALRFIHAHTVCKVARLKYKHIIYSFGSVQSGVGVCMCARASTQFLVYVY